MKIVNVIGGLGNQMFCYAFALALQDKHNEEVYIDISHFNHYGLHNGFQVNEIFHANKINIALPKDIRKLTHYIPHYKFSRILRRLLPVKSTEYIEKQDYVYDDLVLNKPGSYYYDGYWQSPMYFEDIKSSIVESFSFQEPIGKNKEIADLIRSVNSVSIHIRRGDYLNAKSFVGICELDYYKRAISHIQSKINHPYYFIFSNDIEWCKENLLALLNTDKVEFISNNQGNESYWDMYLMSCCKNMIIANSSFSWWGAYLNENDKPLIISPSKWVNRKYDTDIHLNSWVKI